MSYAGRPEMPERDIYRSYMENKKLERWARALLDTGKRNNLVNFRETKSSSAEILMPSAEELFQRALAGAEFEVLDIGPDGSGTVPDRDTYLNTYAEKLRKKKQILLYSAKGDPAASVRNIEKRARSVIEETGVNVAYMAFGFVNWTDASSRQEVFRAPLILIPIHITRKSAIDPWLIRAVDDELVVNPTFDYLITAEKGISLPPYSDEETLAEYLLNVQDRASKLGWTVSAECWIGLFSFLKINMYHDLIDHEEMILRNDNVLTLLGEPIQGTPRDTEEEAGDPIISLHTVVDADSSQMEAILMAKQGKSFVLQGPPGTGKSQTITNIIAECLHDGKKVLFVSEKQAALNVVYDKLVKAGLQDFCLELHSYKANKKDVIAELVRTLNAEKTGVLLKARDVIDTKARFMEQLGDYERELHTPVDGVDESVYEMYGHLLELENTPDTGFTIRGIEGKGADHLREAGILLETFVTYVPEIGEDYRAHTWYGYTGRDGSAAAFDRFTGVTGRAIGLMDELWRLFAWPADSFGLNCASFRDLCLHMNAMALLGSSRMASPELLNRERLSRVLSVSRVLCDKSRDVVSLRSGVLAEYTERFLDLDGHELHKGLLANDGFLTRLFGSEYRHLAAEMRACSRDGRKRNYEKLVRDAEMLALYQDKLAAFLELADPAVPYLGDSYIGPDSDWDSILSGLSELESAFDGGLPLAAYAHVCGSGQKKDMVSMAGRLRPVVKDLAGLFTEMQQLFDSRVLDFFKDETPKVRERLERCMSAGDSFYNWSRFHMTLRQMETSDLTEFTDFVIDNGFAVRNLPDLYRKTFYTCWVNCVTLRNDPLADFTRATQDMAVREFAKTDRMQFDISRARIRSELSARRPSTDLVVPGSQVAVLRREGEKKRKQKAIRTLFNEIGDLILLLKPCFLMSPLSVGTFLSGSEITFDTVVFDEASQIFPQDAVGAVYRGRQLIVVGDSRQMPPTNFFTSMVETESDEETGDVADFESILDICQAAFPQLSLKWHYRSRYESLIAFSNNSFYGGSLITFPSVTRDRAGVGVDYCYVPDGVFMRKTRQNAREASSVLDTVYREIREHPERSLGVVAFSIAQQEMIDRMLAARRREDPSFEDFFSRDREEPFFIKNLETVQGDERDTIIFSTAYGRDESGKFYHNFGPLNRAGGERRLNVAVTRARENVILVSSMHFTDIDPKKSSADGVIALRNYLEYAEIGQGASENAESRKAPAGSSSDPLISSVCDFLTERGMQADVHVGVGKANVEIGVRDAEGRDYVLAIETDGDIYHAMANIRDRDRLRQEVLERMGWNYYRIWSTEWLRNGAVERDRLLAACDEALSAADESEAAPSRSVECEPEMNSEDFEYTEEEEISFSIYRQADVVRLVRNCGFFQEYISEILKIESPVSEEELLKRIVFVFGRDHVTNAVKREFEDRMAGCERFGIERRGGFLYLSGEDPYVFRIPGVKRPVKYIAPEELAGGMRDILHENVSAGKDALYLKIVKMLGYSRVTDAMREKLDQAYELI